MRLLFLFIFVTIQHVTFAQNLPEWAQQKFQEQSSFLNISDSLTPRFLEADFDGDGNEDIVITVKNKEKGNKIGLIFYLRSGNQHIVGAGDPFGAGGSDFKWADKWTIFTNEKTYQTTYNSNGDIQGTEQILLKNPAVHIQTEDGIGGLIYFDGEQFIWIQHGD
ncbi:hypothetical protein [Fodinibius halophilus]|uniref:VCBS repeat-containing protein n=1 Tax=Fodinibius halophilus TaxID=1736908 RepID=A0A6M1TGJ0_9BACT|nr:hypothetical protein [Fodinibius halophilus]NGP89904.1 hypothetical protein [Fodinibius halophilus]